ncbi:helix-turn-helix domain-containing protein [Luedemannella flava]|uniref:Helix-turn-helix domain-containing protein n=1 Tax=Luedemannella flava TaxID=349316 RepID=A0ABN2LAV1_9ACTN
MSGARTLDERAAIHAALGDPARLAIVDMLVLGDASPGEVAHNLALPTNLVAHHLNVLQDAGLIVRTTSEGDRRRTYVHLLPDTLAGLLVPQGHPAARVVFVCTHNSARSQLAAALWAQQSAVPAASAGTQPAARVHPRAVRVARRHGLTVEPTGTRHVADVLRSGDLVIAVCDNAHERLPEGARALHWSVPDPVRDDTDAAFEAAYADIAARISRIAPLVTAPTAA